jgi:hypothetical protein
LATCPHAHMPGEARVTGCSTPCSTDPASIDAEELLDLFAQLASHAPSHSFHLPGSTLGQGPLARQPGSTEAGIEPKPDASSSQSSDQQPGTDAARWLSAAQVRGAVRLSHVCIAAFTGEQHLPAHQHLHNRGLASLESSSEGKACVGYCPPACVCAWPPLMCSPL